MLRGRAALILSILVAGAMWSGPALAQSEAEIAQARRTFGEAMKDEERNDFETALGKFRKVQAVKDTANVRYRIATCLVGLGKLVEARAAYQATEELARTDPSQADVANAAHEKVVDLDKRLPSLTLTLSQKAPTDAAVQVDGQPLPATALGHPMPVEIGTHHIAGRATGAPPFDTDVTMQAGGRVSMTVALDPGVPASQQQQQQQGGPEHPPPTKPPPTLAWVLVGGGAALLAVSAVTIIVRENAISTLKDLCPSDRCPESKRGEVTSARDRAKTILPVSIVTGVAGALAVGTGVTLLVLDGKERNAPAATPPSAPTTTGRPHLRAFISPAIGGLAVDGAF